MKKNKDNATGRMDFSWEEIERAMAAGRQERDEREKYEWDRPLVDETWSVDEPVTGEIPPVPAPTGEEGALKGLTGLLPAEDAIFNATLNEDLDLSAAISRKLESVAETKQVDEQAIRSSVDKKIVVKSEELKSKRDKQEPEPKRKVRRRIPKNTDEPKEAKKKHLSAAEKREMKYKHADLQDDAKMSDFRARSMDWKDGAPSSHGEGEAEDFGNAMGRVFKHFKHYTALEWVSVVLAVMIVGMAAMTTSVYANYKGEQNRAAAIEALKKFESSEKQRVAETVVEEEEPAAVGAQDAIVEVKSLSLVLTSVEKDLKIKLVDQDDALVKGIPWGVTVTDEDGKVSDNDDDDEDGIIYLTDIGAGDYSVELKPNDALADYILPKSAQTVSVKAKIEYKVIANIKDEIKSEKEVNAAAEDNGNKAADVETGSLQDTVEWVESTKTASGETYVETPVCLENTGKGTMAKSFGTSLRGALSSLAAAIGSGYDTVLGAPLYLASAESEPTEPAQAAEPEPATPEPEPVTPDPPKPEPQLVGVTISTSSLKIGDKATLGYDGSNLDGYTVEFSADSGCVSISGNTLTAVSPGTANITARIKEKPEIYVTNASVTVAEPEKILVTKITVSADPAAIGIGASATAKAVVEPDNANNKAVTWSSSDTKIATVDKNSGAIKGIAAGKAVITATAADGSNTTGSVEITVTEKKVAVTKLTLKPDKCSVAVKGNYQLAVAVEPTNATDKTVTWATSDKTVATVSDGGLVTGVKEGSVTITATAHDGSGKTAVCKVTVTNEKLYDDTAQLYDKDKNPLYLRKDDGSYALAKYADYKKNNAIKLYKKTEGFLYTGWQTIDGKTYYYKRDNTYVTGEQVIGGVKYHFATDGSLTQGSGTLGIDVSKYQPSINWSSVKNSGVSFVIIRCGYRGSSTGVLIQDPYFVSHIKGAKAAGLKVGVYFFTTALTEAEAIEEASMCAYLCSGYGINYPVFMDCESSSRPGYNGLSAAQRTQIIQAFCNTLKSAGYTPGVYANKTWLTEKMNASSLSGYKIWLAQYNANGPTYNGRYDLWQYTSKGTVSGISGNVDMNQSYLGY
ncbi:MAG: Ig-like domain-containing protein [Lachnospiraceae bacterium]|nr:Ig-like domain-containing protein [Lachnospiraceae bacterium]